MWRSQVLLFAFDQRRAAVSRFDTEDHFGGFGTSGSQQASQTDDLAGANFEIKRCYRSFFAVIFERGNGFVAQQCSPGTL